MRVLLPKMANPKQRETALPMRKRTEFLVGLFWTATLSVGIFFLLTMSGCVLSAHHISDPRVANDSFDYACAGAEVGESLRVRADLCASGSPDRHSEFVHVSVEWRPYE